MEVGWANTRGAGPSDLLTALKADIIRLNMFIEIKRIIPESKRVDNASNFGMEVFEMGVEGYGVVIMAQIDHITVPNRTYSDSVYDPVPGCENSVSLMAPGSDVQSGMKMGGSGFTEGG